MLTECAATGRVEAWVPNKRLGCHSPWLGRQSDLLHSQTVVSFKLLGVFTGGGGRSNRGDGIGDKVESTEVVVLRIRSQGRRQSALRDAHASGPVGIKETGSVSVPFLRSCPEGSRATRETGLSATGELPDWFLPALETPRYEIRKSRS